VGEEKDRNDQILVTVGITTKNRAEEVARCVASLAMLNVPCEIIVVDDGSETPVEPLVRAAAAKLQDSKLTLIRWDKSRNYMAARNEIVRLAKGEIVLNLDDDAYLLDGAAVTNALSAMAADGQVGALAFPECDAAGNRKRKQPGRSESPSFTTHYYGYAHAVRRDAFLEVGGYREFFGFYHEESDMCKRLLDRGLRCVYWPTAKVAHVPSIRERSDRSLLRFKHGMRNRCLDAMCNEPVPLVWLTLASHVLRYAVQERRFRREFGIDLTGGSGWLVRELRRFSPETRKERKPLHWRVFWTWRWVRRVDCMYVSTVDEPPVASD